MKDQQYSSHSLKLAIVHLPKLSQKLIGSGKPYEKLLDEIIKLDPYGYEPFPTDKSMIKGLGITPSLYRKWLHQIYADLTEMPGDEGNPKFDVAKQANPISLLKA